MAANSGKETDQLTGTETTGHEWDGIKELNTPLPRWWVWTLYITIVWAVVYTVLYPAWPMISTNTKGLLGHTNRMALEEAIQEHVAAQKKYVDAIASMSVDDIQANRDLLQFARAGGAAIFRNYCSQCHGSGATGAKGYPNLQDDDWLWGGTLDEIDTTIAHGIRFEQDEDTRLSEMPAFGRDELLTKDEIATVAQHVLSLSGKADPTAEGAELFADNCAACHGDEGKGGPEVGAPNLTDNIWLYGGDLPTVVATITNSRAGVMPAWTHRLDEVQIKQVALYVYGLGGGQ